VFGRRQSARRNEESLCGCARDSGMPLPARPGEMKFLGSDCRRSLSRTARVAASSAPAMLALTSARRGQCAPSQYDRALAVYWLRQCITAGYPPKEAYPSRVDRRATSRLPKTQKSTPAISLFQFVTNKCKLIRFPLWFVSTQDYTCDKMGCEGTPFRDELCLVPGSP
jgi:hypothetical protein